MKMAGVLRFSLIFLTLLAVAALALLIAIRTAVASAGAFRVLGVEPKSGGETVFRYDDTNPDAEAQEYIDNQVRPRWALWQREGSSSHTHRADGAAEPSTERCPLIVSRLSTCRRRMSPGWAGGPAV
jgi:hypothetical protein